MNLRFSYIFSPNLQNALVSSGKPCCLILYNRQTSLKLNLSDRKRSFLWFVGVLVCTVCVCVCVSVLRGPIVRTVDYWKTGWGRGYTTHCYDLCFLPILSLSLFSFLFHHTYKHAQSPWSCLRFLVHYHPFRICASLLVCLSVWYPRPHHISEMRHFREDISLMQKVNSLKSLSMARWNLTPKPLVELINNVCADVQDSAGVCGNCTVCIRTNSLQQIWQYFSASGRICHHF